MIPQIRQRREEWSHTLTSMCSKPYAVIGLVSWLVSAGKLPSGSVLGTGAVVRHFKPALPAVLSTKVASKPIMCSFVYDQGLQPRLFYVVFQA
jgi:hypothetical protein